MLSYAMMKQRHVHTFPTSDEFQISWNRKKCVVCGRRAGQKSRSKGGVELIVVGVKGELLR